MMIVKSVADVSTDQQVHRVRRARSFRRPVLLWFTALLLFLSFVSFVAFLTFGTLMVLQNDKTMGIFALAAISAMVVTRLWAALYTRRLTCPLCMGTVLHEKTCRKHGNARRFPLLGYRTTAVLSALLCLGFTCMYCGTAFRLKK